MLVTSVPTSCFLLQSLVWQDIALGTQEPVPKRGLSSCTCRLDIAAERWSDVKAGLAKAEALCAEGGDWERKNKLKVASAHSTAGIRSALTFVGQTGSLNRCCV